MKKVASRAELAALTGRPALTPVPQPVTVQPHAPSVDPNILAMQMQVSDVARAVGDLAAAVHAQAEAQAMRPNALEATIQRDGKGLAQKIIITRVAS